MRTRSRSSQGEDLGDSASPRSALAEADPSQQDTLSSRRSTRSSSRRTTAQQADFGAEPLTAIPEELGLSTPTRQRRQTRSSASQVHEDVAPASALHATTPRRRRTRQHQEDAEEQQQQQQQEGVQMQQEQQHQEHQEVQLQQEQQQQLPVRKEQGHKEEQHQEEEQHDRQHSAADHAAEQPSTASEGEGSESDEEDGSGSLQQLLTERLASAPAAARAHAAAQPWPRMAAEGLDDSDADDEELDSEAMLERLAASIGAAFGGQAAAEPRQQQQQQEQQEQQAAGDASDAEQLAWRPDTGLQPAIAHGTTAAGATAGAGEKLPSKERGLAGQLRVPPRDAVRAAKEAKKGAPDTAGAKWYGLPATAIDEDMKRDLRLLRLRGAYDPKRFYKSFDKGKFPKYFQVGTVLDDPLDFYGGRLTKAERKTTLTEQLLADTDLTASRKRRYSKLQVEAQKYTKVKKRKTDLPRNKAPHHRKKR